MKLRNVINGLGKAGRCKLYDGRGIRKTPLCTVGYNDKWSQKLVAWMMLHLLCLFLQLRMAYVNRPNELTANAGHHVAVTTNIRVRRASRRLEGHIRKKKMVWGGKRGKVPSTGILGLRRWVRKCKFCYVPQIWHHLTISYPVKMYRRLGHKWRFVTSTVRTCK